MAFDYGTKIRALLAHADDEALSDEARQAYRNRAFDLMRKYQIAEEDALATDPTAAAPTHMTIEFRVNEHTMTGWYSTMAVRIAEHTGCRVHVELLADYVTRRLTVVGYEGDVRYFEFLWTSAHLMFSTRIDPRWDPSLSVDENVYRMRQAGIKRREIADRAGWDGSNAASRSRVQRVYLKAARDRGETASATGLGFDSRNYRESYANSFVNTLTRRMREARDAADSAGGVLVFAGRQQRVDEAFYELFPRMKPSDVVVAEYVDPRKGCARCEGAASGYCRSHAWLKPRKWTQADQARLDRQTYGASALAGRASGRAAAEGVHLRGTTAREDRIDSGTQAIEG